MYTCTQCLVHSPDVNFNVHVLVHVDCGKLRRRALILRIPGLHTTSKSRGLSTVFL